jgi:hypothetical protein
LEAPESLLPPAKRTPWARRASARSITVIFFIKIPLEKIGVARRLQFSEKIYYKKVYPIIKV